MKPSPSVELQESPSTTAAESGALTKKRCLVALTAAPRMLGASAEGEPSPYDDVLTKNRFPNERTFRRTTDALVPWQTATETLWCSKLQSLSVIPSGCRADPEGEISTPATKR